MKRKKLYILTIFFIFSFALHSKYIDFENIDTLPKKETIQYKGISKKEKLAFITEYNVLREKDSVKIKEVSYEGKLKKDILNVFLLEKDNINIEHTTEKDIILRTIDMLVVYVKTLRNYKFGVIKEEFDIRNSVVLNYNENNINVFNFSFVEQIARHYPFTSKKQIYIKMPTSSESSKMKFAVHNNGVKKIKIENKNGEEIIFEVYELELKIEGVPFAAFMPKITAYVEKYYPNRVLKYTTMASGMDTVDFYLTDYTCSE